MDKLRVGAGNGRRDMRSTGALTACILLGQPFHPAWLWLETWGDLPFGVICPSQVGSGHEGGGKEAASGVSGSAGRCSLCAFPLLSYSLLRFSHRSPRSVLPHRSPSTGSADKGGVPEAAGLAPARITELPTATRARAVVPIRGVNL